MSVEEPSAETPWRVRAYRASRRVCDPVLRLTNVFGTVPRALFTGAWLGVLDPDALHAADEMYYRHVRMYYEDSYNLSGLFRWEADCLDRHFHGCRSLIVTAAGGGREVVALERRGLDVRAFECHPALVEAANALLSRNGLSARVVPAPRDGFPPGFPRCDGAVVGWGSYMLIQPRERRIRFLRQLRDYLPSDGPVLLSFFALKQHTAYFRRTAAIANRLRIIRRKPRVDIGDDLIPNFVHHFTEAEIVADLGASGYRMIEFSWEGYPHAIARVGEVVSDGGGHA